MCFELAKLKKPNESREGGVGSQTNTTANEIKSEITVIETSAPANQTTTPARNICGECGTSKCQPTMAKHETSKSADSTLPQNLPNT